MYPHRGKAVQGRKTMHRVLRTAGVALALITLWGCGASVDGGNGKVFEGSDLATTVSLDQNSAQAGTNVLMTAEISNS